MFFTPSSLVLQNPDLLDTIFSFCDSHSPQELLWASLTSKAFLEPALSVLWHDVCDVLLKLCRLLPTSNKETYAFDKVIRDQDFERVLYYARRIRVLTFDIGKFNRCPDITLDVSFSLFNRINKAATFHSLRTLKIFDNSTIQAQATIYQDQKHPFVISAPNLETLELYGEHLPEIPTATLLHTISSESPNLKSLVFGTVATWTKTIIDVVPCFHQLQLLNIQGMDGRNPTDFLKNCALSMTSLRSLMVDFHNFRRPASTRVSRNLYLITFGLLSNLDLSGHSRDIKDMLDILFVPKLDTLTLVFQSGDGQIIIDIDPFVERFLTSNGQYLKNGLRTLSLTTNYSGFNFEGYLNSFKAFTKLDSLHVGTFGSRAHVSTSSLANFLDEDELWPDLTAIHLDNGYVDSNRCDDMLSIAALPLLADTFPKLLHIVITIYNPNQDAIKTDTTTNATRTPHGLETLRFARQLPYDWIDSTSSAVTIASLLHQLFPKLKTVECWEEFEWITDVQEMLKKEQSM